MRHQHHLQQATQRQAKNYLQSQLLIEEMGKQLLSRIDYLKFNPQIILDLGAGQGIDTKRLEKNFANALVISMDVSHAQLHHGPASSKNHRCVADAHTLPLPAASIDLIFANALLPFLIDYPALWEECLRALKPGGVLLFSGLGSLSFQELRTSLGAFEKADSVNTFIDMHDVGDGLLHSGFQDPALDSEIVQLHYSNITRLLKELKQLGSIKLWGDYPHVYYGKTFWSRVEEYYREHFSQDEKLVASVEIYYGIAFAPSQRVMSDASISIPISEIKKRA